MPGNGTACTCMHGYKFNNVTGQCLRDYDQPDPEDGGNTDVDNGGNNNGGNNNNNWNNDWNNENNNGNNNGNNNNNNNNQWWEDNNNQESGASYGAVIAITLSVIACVALIAIVVVHAKKVAGRRRGEAVELTV